MFVRFIYYSKSLVQYTLWGELASQCYNYYNSNKDVGKVIVLMQNARIKGAQGIDLVISKTLQ